MHFLSKPNLCFSKTSKMKKNYNLLLFSLLLNNFLFSQCTNTSPFGSVTASTSNCTGVQIATNQYATEYATLNSIVGGNNYQLTSSVTSDWITIRRDAFNGTVVSFAQQGAVWTAPSSGTYYAHVNTNSSCGTASTNRTTTLVTIFAQNFAVESSSITANSACINGNIPVGSGAYKDVTIAANTYYNFTAPGSFAANANGMLVVPQNGTGNGGTVTLTAGQSSNNWFSGTTTTIRVSARRSSCTWVATSATLTYRNTQPSAVSMSAATNICSGSSTNVTASGGTYGTMYWQGTTASGRSTATASSSQSVSIAGTYYFTSNNNGCWTDPSGGSTITVRAAFNGGTLASSTQTICNNTSPANITYSSAPSGGSSLQYQWYRQTGTIAAPSGTFSIGSWTAVGTQTASSTLSGATIGNLTATTSFACRVIDVGSPACFDNWAGNVHVVTVRALFDPGSILTTGQTICNGGTPTVIGNNALPSGGDASYTYSWRSSADGYAAPIGGATSSTYTPPIGLTTTTSYRRYARDGTCNTTPVVSTGTWTVTVQNAFNSGSLSSSSQTICYNAQPASITYSSAPSGGSSLQYQWYRQTGTIAAPSGSFSIGSWTAVGSQTASSTLSGATIGNLTATTSFACRVVDVGSPACFDNWAGNVHVVTVRSLFNPGSILETGETICNGGTPTTLIGNNALPSGGDAAYTYSWRSSADSYTAAIGGATASTYTPTASLTTTTSYRRYASDGT
jgi:hypothetical protein